MCVQAARKTTEETDQTPDWITDIDDVIAIQIGTAKSSGYCDRAGNGQGDNLWPPLRNDASFDGWLAKRIDEIEGRHLADITEKMHRYKEQHEVDTLAWHTNYRQQLEHEREENLKLRCQIEDMKASASRAIALRSPS